VTGPGEDDEFERIRLTDQIERYRLIVAQYDVHQAQYRARIENNRYELGRLDERLKAMPYPWEESTA
jgi:hypothetical protein